MNYPALMFWMVVFNTGISMVVALFSWWSSREKVTNTRFSKLEKQVTEMVSKPELVQVKDARDKQVAEIKKVTDNVTAACTCHPDMLRRVDGHNDRLSQHKELIVKIEGEFKSLPKKHDLENVYDRVNKVHQQMADLRSEVGKISGALPGIAHITEMMNKFLLDNGGKK